MSGGAILVFLYSKSVDRPYPDTNVTHTCFCGHSSSGAPLLKYHGNWLPLKKRKVLQIEVTVISLELDQQCIINLPFEIKTSVSDMDPHCTCFSCLILCFRSPDTHRRCLISSELKSFKVRKLRPLRLTGPRASAPMLQMTRGWKIDRLPIQKCAFTSLKNTTTNTLWHSEC